MKKKYEYISKNGDHIFDSDDTENFSKAFYLGFWLEDQNIKANNNVDLLAKCKTCLQKHNCRTQQRISAFYWFVIT